MFVVNLVGGANAARLHRLSLLSRRFHALQIKAPVLDTASLSPLLAAVNERLLSI